MMTNEIEKKFFDAFGIKAKLDGSDFNKSIPANYPEITDPILLELICIESQVNKAHNTYSDVENLKEHILVGLRPFTEKCYHQVRELFAVNMTTNRKR